MTQTKQVEEIQSNQLPQLSRFLIRWINSNPSREVELEGLMQLSLNLATFAHILQKELDLGANLFSAMRRVRNLVLCSIIQRDLNSIIDVNIVMSAISEFADFVICQHLKELRKELVLIHGEPIGEETGEVQELIVLGMGKLGGKELNVSSDIDLIFCYSEEGETKANTEQRSLSNHEFFSRLGKKLIAAICEVTEDGFTFRVDMALRPNGNSGPLAVSFNMLEEYFFVQGREWERYAWVKARPITGTEKHIETLEKIIRPFVYRRYLDFGVIDSLRSLHQQIRAEVVRQETRHPERGINVKLGRGGIREIEFLAQVFQLIRGGREPLLRDRSTRTTLITLAEKGILDPDLVTQLLEIYSFLRNVEHRLQYLDDAQTHIFPANINDHDIIANMMRFSNSTALFEQLSSRMQFVAIQFDEIFKDKSDKAQEGLSVASFTDNEGNEFIENIENYLKELGYIDEEKFRKRLLITWQSPKMQSLNEASQKKIVTLINNALKIIAKQKHGQLDTLSRMLNFMEAIARRSSYLSLLNEFPHALERVIRMMQASDWAAQFLNQHPLLLDELLDESVLHLIPDWSQLSMQLQEQMLVHDGDTEEQLDCLREVHHAHLFRLLAQDLEGKISVEHLADHVSKLADVIVDSTIQTAWKTIATRHCDIPKFAVIAYGKLGGKELSYASDLDIIFLYEDEDQDAPAAYAKLAQRFITWMTTHTSSGILFDIDTALRPNGASGLMVSSLSAFKRYQEQSAWIWEHQALTRARFCAGDENIGNQFEEIRINVLRQQRDSIKIQHAVVEMRKKMHEANPNRTGLFDLKHDAGGMIDIEFMVQYLVLQYAHQYPELTINVGNIALLKKCGDLHLIDTKLANETANAYRLFRKYQHNARLQGEERAHVEMDKVPEEIFSSRALWKTLFKEESSE
jgi:glutamate-ammonia-ligase adenylyltransferase